MGEGGCKDEGETSKFEDRAKARLGVRARVRGFTSESSSQSNSLCRLASSAGLTSPILLPLPVLLPLLPLLLPLLLLVLLPTPVLLGRRHLTTHRTQAWFGSNINIPSEDDIGYYPSSLTGALHLGLRLRALVRVSVWAWV